MGKSWAQYDLPGFGTRLGPRFPKNNGVDCLCVALRKRWIDFGDVLLIKPKQPPLRAVFVQPLAVGAAELLLQRGGAGGAGVEYPAPGAEFLDLFLHRRGITQWSMFTGEGAAELRVHRGCGALSP